MTSQEVREEAGRIAEQWLVEFSSDPDIRLALGAELTANLTVQFQRLLTYADAATLRKKYDLALRTINSGARTRVVVPLKQAMHAGVNDTSQQGLPSFEPTAFVAHSFDQADRAIVDAVIETLNHLGVTVTTGERPKAARVSDKVRTRIRDAHMFVGVFTRKDKLARDDSWATSAWLIDEKAVAYTFDKPMILLKEEGVSSLGGIQGDYEYVPFSRDNLSALIFRLLELFSIDLVGLR